MYGTPANKKNFEPVFNVSPSYTRPTSPKRTLVKHVWPYSEDYELVYSDLIESWFKQNQWFSEGWVSTGHDLIYATLFKF